MNLDTPAGTVVREWRETRTLTQTELAGRMAPALGREIATVKAYLSKLELNKIDNPRPEYRRAIAQALVIPEEYLVLRIRPSERTNVGGPTQADRPSMIALMAAAPTLPPHPPLLADQLEDLLATAALSPSEQRLVEELALAVVRAALALVATARQEPRRGRLMEDERGTHHEFR